MTLSKFFSIGDFQVLHIHALRHIATATTCDNCTPRQSRIFRLKVADPNNFAYSYEPKNSASKPWVIPTQRSRVDTLGIRHMCRLLYGLINASHPHTTPVRAQAINPDRAPLLTVEYFSRRKGSNTSQALSLPPQYCIAAPAFQQYFMLLISNTGCGALSHRLLEFCVHLKSWLGHSWLTTHSESVK